jgi:hypothetical protein
MRSPTGSAQEPPRNAVSVVPLADVTFRLRQEGHDVTAEQVRTAILHPPGKRDAMTTCPNAYRAARAPGDWRAVPLLHTWKRLLPPYRGRRSTQRGVKALATPPLNSRDAWDVLRKWVPRGVADLGVRSGLHLVGR